MGNWTRGEALAMADHNCTTCYGGGWLSSQKRKDGAPCRCALRKVFRACLAKFQRIQEEEARINIRQIDAPIGAGSGRYTYGHKKQEYCADFYLIAKRNLQEMDWRIFSYYFLLGADWVQCTKRLGIDRGTFFRHVYQIEERLGRVFRELKPYPLYPIREYFAPVVIKGRAA